MNQAPSAPPGLGRRLGRALSRPLRGLAALWRAPRKTALTLASAFAIVLAFPPYEIYPLVFIAWVPLLFVIDGLRGRSAFGWGLLAGFTLTALGFYFMVPMLAVFGGVPAAFAVFLHGLFSVYQGLGIALFAALTAWLRGRGDWPMVWIVPFTYVAAELVARTIFIFPWYLGNATYPFTAFIQAADLFGGFGLTALVALTNGVVYEVVRAALARRRGDHDARIPWRAVTVTAALLVANVVYGVVRIGQVEAVMAERPTIRVGLVEANIGPFQKRDRELVFNNMLIHQHLSAQLERQGVDLIVWPETAVQAGGYAISRRESTDLAELEGSLEVVRAVPRDVTWFRPSEAPLVADYRDDLSARTPPREVYGVQRGFRTPLLFGTLTSREPTPEEAAAIPPHPLRPPLVYYNTAVLLDAEGRVLGTYDKSVLLVLGEYVPLASWLWRTFGINFFEAFPSAGNVTPGESLSVMELPIEQDDGTTLTVRIGAMICYEDIITEYALALAEMRPNLFINIINDGWFLETSAAQHHMAFSVLRAVEHRIPLVRATNTGVSSVIDPVGRVVQRTQVTEVETIVADLPVMPPPATLYSKVGDVAGWLAWIGVVGLAVMGRRRSKTFRTEAAE